MTNGLVVASNRGPVSWRRTGTGELAPRRGAGGLVTALGGALQQEDGTWVSVALSGDDARVATDHEGKPFTVDADGSQYRLRLLDAGERFDDYYNEVANRLLWFTVHALWGEPYEPSGAGWSQPWREGYLVVNRQVGEAVAESAGPNSEIYLQDYHLCAAPAVVRESLPHAPLLHYIHTPWVEPTLFGRLPDEVVRGVLEGLLAADVVAFSAATWCDAFRRCAARYLEAGVHGELVTYRGRATTVADFTLGVDAADLASVAGSPEVARAGRTLDDHFGDRRLVVRVDRTDLSKNILRGLHAFELLLERHPEHRQRVCHYAHLNPSRQGVPEYRRYLETCQAAADRIAERFGGGTIHLEIADDFPGAVAALQRYEVLLTNPVIDGTNLVAKEGPTVNQRDGALVLSRSAGAARTLADAALLVNPHDVEQTAEALHAALTMDVGERAARAAILRERASIGSPEEWFAAQRAALRTAAARRP
jgi:trehalose 6-phosphate synthase